MVLVGAGNIRREQAMNKAKCEFKKYRNEEAHRLESVFGKMIKRVK